MAKGKVKEAPADAEAIDAEGVEGEVAPVKKKPPLKLIIIGAVAGVLVLGGGGAAALILMKPKPEAAGDHKPEPKKKKKAAKGEGGKAEAGAPVIKEGPDGVVFYTLPDMVVNMQSADGKPTYLKLKLTLELPDDSLVDSLTESQPRMQDMFQTFLRELRPEDLNGSQGNYQLRMEILRRVNLLVAPSKINAVLIEEMLIT